MNATNDTCRLDYLAGTLATAYKGSLTSLVTRDFCMSDTGTVTTLTGTILSMPDSDYEASLTTHGDELSRCMLQRGRFEFTADSAAIAAARGLQIDIIQAGRHIGTFLLKQERAGGLFGSALELSAELAGVDLSRLSQPLRDKVGLWQRAEEIIALLHSTKKDWTAFSEKLDGLSLDLFWSAPDVFSSTFDILARFTLLAAERAGAAETSKPLANYFDLLDLALRQQPDRIAGAAALWTSLLAQSTIDLSAEARRVCATLRSGRGALSGADLAAVVRSLVASLRRKDRSGDLLDDGALARLGRALPQEDVERLGRFGAPGSRAFNRLLGDAEARLNKGDPFAALDLIDQLDLEVLEEHKALDAFFDLAEERLAPGSAEVFAGLFAAVFSLDRRPDSRSGRALRQEAPAVFTRLLALGRPDLCAALLRTIEESGSLLNDRLLLDPKVADAVLGSDEPRLREQYISSLTRVLIPAARVRGISPDTWAEVVDPGHLGTLVAFLELLAHQDGRLGAVLVHVIANLSVGGVLIPDDRLFQRTVSLYLGSPLLGEQFLLSILLLGLFPVYFNEVGAASRIRDYSTDLDSWGDDPVIYFLRKQVHVNASSRNVELVGRLFASWARGDASLLRGFVPPDILAQSDPGLARRYAAVIGELRDAVSASCEGGAAECLLGLDDKALERLIGGVRAADREAREKVRLLISLSRELTIKYGFRSREPDAGDPRTALRDAVSGLAEQKSIMLEPERTLPQESLYFKRHIAFGIPSVLGSYHERKFDACGAFLRNGERAKVLFEQLIDDTAQRPALSPEDLRQRLSDLALAWQMLKLYGLTNAQIDEFVLVLEENGERLNPAQIADVLRMWQKELAWLVSSLSKTFHSAITDVLRRLPQDDLPDHLQDLGKASPDFIGKAADVVMRDLLSGIPGLVESDRLLHALLLALRSGSGARRDEERPAAARQDLPPFFVLGDLTAAETLRRAPDLGNKAKNLVLLKDHGLRIPAGVVLPSLIEAPRDGSAGEPGYGNVLIEAVRALESATGRRFGGADRPLFLSVRSGSYLSMPGILSSILYCGMNDRSRDAFIGETGSPDLGWDSHRRFIEHYAAAVFGLGDAFFDELAPALRKRLATTDGRPLGADAFQELVERYREGLRARDLVVPDNPYEQLLRCVRAIYASWNSERARQFRSITGASDAWGTAVTLMEMVSGNRSGGGASSFFTRDPVTLEPVPYGETRASACGDDLASGRLSGMPLSRRQAKSGRESLEERDPELFRLHAGLARDIEAVFGGLPQEIEVTYVRDDRGRPLLSVLQTRRMEQGAAHAERFAGICGMGSRVIGHGTGANGGAVSGRASFARDAAAVDALRKTSGMPVILLRRTADTDDVSLMPHIAGIVTLSGGVTSHAAVLAHKFDLAAVVSCTEMDLRRDEAGTEYARFGASEIREGSSISIDGATGLVFSGECLATTAGSARE